MKRTELDWNVAKYIREVILSYTAILDQDELELYAYLYKNRIEDNYIE